MTENLFQLIQCCKDINLKQKAQKELDIIKGVIHSWMNIHTDTPFEEQIV